MNGLRFIEGGLASIPTNSPFRWIARTQDGAVLLFEGRPSYHPGLDDWFDEEEGQCCRHSVSMEWLPGQPPDLFYIVRKKDVQNGTLSDELTPREQAQAARHLRESAIGNWS